MQVVVHSMPRTLQQATADPHLCWRVLDTNSQASLGKSLVRSLLLYPGFWCTQGSVCALKESISPVLCKFWWLCGGVKGDLLQEGLCYTQVCCTQGPCPCGSPRLTRTTTGDAHSSVSVSVGSLGPGAHKVCLSPLNISGRYGV